MSESEPVVWIGDAPREAATRALNEWARARGVRLLSLDDAAPSSTAPRIDHSLADKAEKEIDRAREALGSGDADAAERALARADALLRNHPELPQAAWLRAEVERGWAQRWLRLEPRDEARARVAWENAQAIDAGRVAGVGETSFPPRAKVPTTIVMRNGNGNVTLRFDGRVLNPSETSSGGALIYKLDVAPAEHHVHVMTDGGSRIVFASWVAVASGAAGSAERIDINAAGGGGGSTCTREDLAPVHRDPGDPSHVVAEGVTCGEWIAALPAPGRPGTVYIARCERDRCAQMVEWSVERFGAVGPPQALSKSSHWPAWATWTLVGIGAATATSVALVATGVFESRPVEPRFVVGGARQN